MIGVYVLCPAIQRKGCLAIHLLSSAEHFTSQPLCVSLASAVMGALSQWRTEPEVEVEVSHPFSFPVFLLTTPPSQFQALVCTHKLCLSSERMAGALVKRDLHLLLFKMLYDRQDSHESLENEEETRDTSATSSQLGKEKVKSEKDCK